MVMIAGLTMVDYRLNRTFHNALSIKAYKVQQYDSDNEHNNQVGTGLKCKIASWTMSLISNVSCRFGGQGKTEQYS